jgi:hypothetical protein
MQAWTIRYILGTKTCSPKDFINGRFAYFKLFLPSLLTLSPVSQVCDLENVLIDDQARLQDALVLIAYHVINSAAS